MVVADTSEEVSDFLVSWTGPDGDSSGPLSTLWELIESYRIDIFDVSLVKITEDFLTFLRSRTLALEIASAFAVMAARLLYYKSRALLPDPGFEEEAADRLPPELIQQLLEHRKFQFAAEKLRDLDDITSGMMRRGSKEESTGDEYFEASLGDLVQAYLFVLQRIKDENPVAPYEIHYTEITVEEKVAFIRNLLQNAVSCNFIDLLVDLAKRGTGEVLAAFLAILELTKLGEIVLRQKGTFATIEIHKKSAVLS